MKWFLLGICSFLLKPQDEEKIKQTIVAEIPDFYIQNYKAGFNREYLGFLNPPPESVSRKYHIKNVSAEGGVSKNFKEFTEEEFYKLAVYIMGYGARDNDEFSYYLNEGYKNFVKLLLKHEIVTNNGLAQFGKIYQKFSWVESVYCLDEVLAGFWKDDDWQKRISETHFPHFCFAVLIDIKNGKPPNEIRKELDQLLTEKEAWPGSHFRHWGKSYAELIRKGADFPEDVQFRLFSSFADWELDFDLRVRETYLRAGLPLPEKNIISKVLLEKIRISSGEPLSRVLERFSNLGIEFPKEYAPSYRDALLKDFGDFADIMYLIKLSGKDAEPKLWKKYADRALDWYGFKENRKIHLDIGDYYHFAIEGYRRASAGGIKISKEITDSLIEQGAKDFCVHTHDLIVAYELAGENPKSSHILEKLEERIEVIKQFTAGAFYYPHQKDSLDQLAPPRFFGGEVRWFTNEYLQPIIPFREEIELAAYLNEPDRTRALSKDIAKYLAGRLEKEGPELVKAFNKWYLYFSNNIEEFWLYEYLSFRKSLLSLESPAHVELAAIIDLYETLKFKDGLRCLAQYLCDDGGFYLEKRRAFQLCGLGKRLTELEYWNHDDAYWKKEEIEYDYKVRKEAIRLRRLADVDKKK